MVLFICEMEGRLIFKVGYDPQKALLMVQFRDSGRKRYFINVPEEIWYGIKRAENPDRYYRLKIQEDYFERQCF